MAHASALLSYSTGLKVALDFFFWKTFFPKIYFPQNSSSYRRSIKNIWKATEPVF